MDEIWSMDGEKREQEIWAQEERMLSRPDKHCSRNENLNSDSYSEYQNLPVHISAMK